jgi:hypothetical protein
MIRNEPSPEGREAGFHLARLAWTAREELVAAGVIFEEPCRTCAFRLGTYPNGCAQTILDAIECMREDEEFYCHERPDLPLRVCAGFKFFSEPAPAAKR